jgi:hypothetical protein
MYPRFTFPKIFADELAGLDAGQYILNSQVERFTGYRAGLGLLLQPILFISSDREVIYRYQQLLNCAILGAATLICFQVLRHMLSMNYAFLVSLSSFVFFPVLYSLMRITTEIWLALSMSLALYLYASIFSSKKQKHVYIAIFVLQFISIIHLRLMILNIIIMFIYFLTSYKVKGKQYSNLVFGLFSFFGFSAVNYKFSNQTWESSFSNSLLPEGVNVYSVIELLLIFFGKLFFVTLQSFGLFFFSCFFLLIALRQFLKNTKNEEPGLDLQMILLVLIMLTLFPMIFVSSLFEYLLTTNPIWGETIGTIIFATRYIDSLLPVVFAITSANLPVLTSVYRKYLTKVFLIVSSTLVFLLVVLILNLGAIVSDPMRSPFGFGVSKARIIEGPFLTLAILFVIFFSIFAALRTKLFLIVPICGLAFASTPLAWEAGIEEIGWQRNHGISDFANDYLESSQKEYRCISMNLTLPENWWSQYNYRFWSEFPVYSSTNVKCAVSITDIDSNSPTLFQEEQATPIYLKQVLD